MQEIPANDRKGRVHTSTVTVAVLNPTATRHDSKLDQRADSDFRIEWYSGTVGAGGQHKNKHANSARITHIPTGIVRTAQGRQRETNKRDAMTALIGELDRLKKEGTNTSLSAERRAQTGSGMRGDKIRTMRYQDDITTDHRTGKTASTKRIMKGQFDLLS